MLMQYEFKVIPPNPIAITIQTQLQGNKLCLVQDDADRVVPYHVSHKLPFRNMGLIGCSTPTYGDLVW